jgi:AcrR family transcriptional regulator
MVASKRAYNAEGRKAQAKKTRATILVATRELLATKGFDTVTVDEIAHRANVSSPTVYALFQSKSGILKELLDVALPAHDYEALVKELEAETDLPKRLALTAALTRKLYDAEREQLGLFRDVSILSPELKKLETAREQRRYTRQAGSFEKFKDTAALGALNTPQARDLLWAFTGRDMYRMLVIERGWSSDEYQAWLTHTLISLIHQRI